MALAAVLPAAGQESASFRLREHVLNAGGHPDQGTLLTSPGFRVTLDALGQAVGAPGLAGGAFAMGGGFVPSHPPPAIPHSARARGPIEA